MARRNIGKKVGAKRGKKAVGAVSRRSTRRRRVGASGSFEPVLMNAAGVGAGVVAMRELSILAGQFMPSLQGQPVMVGIGEVAIGILTAWKAKNGFLMYMGLGGAGNGLMTILNGAGIIGAPPLMSYGFTNRRMMGDPRLQFVAGPTTRIGSYPNNFSAVAGHGIGASPQRKKRYTS